MNLTAIYDEAIALLLKIPRKPSFNDPIFVRGVMTYLGIKEIVDVTSFDDSTILAPGNRVGIIIKSDYWAD